MPEAIRKTGPHLMHYPPFGVIVPLIKKWRPAVIKSLSDGDYLPRLADILQSELDYTPRYVQRVWFDGRGAGHPNNYQGYSYDQWRGACLNTLEACSAARSRGHTIYFESYNETGISHEYLAFEAKRTRRLMDDFGLRAAVINMGVGWSTPAHVDMAIEAGLLDALRDTGSAWAEHGYMMPIGSQAWRGHNQSDLPNGGFSRPIIDIAHDRTIYPATVTDWLTFRIAMTHQAMLARGYDIYKLLTEYGNDDAGKTAYKNYTSGQDVGPWRQAKDYWSQWGYLADRSAARHYAEQLALGEAQMNAPGWEWLLGAVIYTTGSDPTSTWPPFDILDKDMTGSEVIDEFMIVLPEYNIPPQPEPEPEPIPVPDIPPSGCWVTPSGDRVNIRTGPGLNHQPVDLLEPGEAIEVVAVHYEDAGRMWYRTTDGRYIASWVLTAAGECDGLPDETPPPIEDDEPPDEGEDEVTVKPIGIVCRDHVTEELQQIVPLYGANLFMQWGDPREAAPLKRGPFISRTWYERDDVTSDNFMEHVSGSAEAIVDDVLLQYPVLKNFINDHQRAHYVGEQVGNVKEIPNPAFSPECIIELPINGDAVPKHLLPLYFAVSAVFAERLNSYVDPATNLPLQRNLMGCFVNRDITLDADRAQLWEMAKNNDLLKNLVRYGGYIQLRFKADGLFSNYPRSRVFPEADLQWLADKGFGSIPVVLVVEWKGGYRSQGLTAEQAAGQMMLLAKTAPAYDNLEVLVLLRQAEDVSDWGKEHDLRGDAENLHLAYLQHPESAPVIAWPPVVDPPEDPDDPPGDDDPPDDDETPTEPSPPGAVYELALDWLAAQKDQHQAFVDAMEAILQKHGR